MTADVQQELTEALTPLPLAYMSPQAVTAALLPTVQALIADAEKRAAAGALMRLGAAARVMWDCTYPVQAVPLSALLDAAALEVPGPRAALAYPPPAPRDRYAQCDDTCTVDCGACKGGGPPERRPSPGGADRRRDDGG